MVEISTAQLQKLKSVKIFGKGSFSGRDAHESGCFGKNREGCRLLKYLLSQSKDITFSDDPTQADAVIVDTEFLTPAEKEVLKALADYGSVEEVAAKTFRAKATVKKHLCFARKKLKAKTNIQAVAFALRYRLIH